jgi:ribonuclease HII
LLAVFAGLNDSKKVSEKKRERIFELLEEFSARGEIYFHVELIPSTFIDEKGIVPAMKLGVERGVRKLLPHSADGKVFLDGSLSAPKEYSQETIIGGDAIVPAIMLASIAAKVTRDIWLRSRIHFHIMHLMCTKGMERKRISQRSMSMACVTSTEDHFLRIG